ncbi:hypothetical protein P170DRAFT_433260 [Aspergillus steynii IBT 23096]|uniref:Uncharacterized protein n=1 Tax=Aspergillus steynii IBT 23096 TaxID=1392250 RepID=A0A2I2GSB8_9EURO|nr:uncharacterized protein P170DRAFT_433260 [Aspergillus steynii IBT 23096]PLB55767.1 hypothetical protein P170DRAFT_433260 [Aspergillus steynii IBT 23096]
MFFRRTSKSDKDDFPYAWYYQGKPIRKGQKPGEKIRPVCPVGHAPALGDPSGPHDVRRESTRPHSRRVHGHDHGHRHATESEAPLLQEGNRQIQSFRQTDFYSATSTSASTAESSSLARRASPDFYDEVELEVSSSSGSEQEDFCARQCQCLSRQEPRPVAAPAAGGYRPHPENHVSDHPSAGYHPPTNRRHPQAQAQAQVQVQTHDPVRASPAPYEATAPRAETLSLPIRSQRARHPGKSGRRRDAGASRRENYPLPQPQPQLHAQVRRHESVYVENPARPARAQREQPQPRRSPEQAESRPPRGERYRRPRPVDEGDDISVRREGQRLSWNREPVGMCQCEICRVDAYS